MFIRFSLDGLSWERGTARSLSFMEMMSHWISIQTFQTSNVFTNSTKMATKTVTRSITIIIALEPVVMTILNLDIK